MRPLALIAGVTLGLSHGGCPPADNAARVEPDPVPIVAGGYGGSIACVASLEAATTEIPDLFEQRSDGSIEVEIAADGGLTVAGQRIEPGATLQSAVPAIAVAQTITEVVATAERITVRYTSAIDLTIDGQTRTFSGDGSYQITGISDAEVRYVEEGGLQFADGDFGFSSVLRCEGTLTRRDAP